MQCKKDLKKYSCNFYRRLIAAYESLALAQCETKRKKNKK